jgi:hypothetical protein
VLLQNKLNINDWSSVQSLFDKLNKQMEKTQKAADSVGTPRVYIKMLVELEDRLYATLANKELTKKMSPTNAKALNTMRQRLRKHNPQFAEEIEKFRCAARCHMLLVMITRLFVSRSWLAANTLTVLPSLLQWTLQLFPATDIV